MISFLPALIFAPALYAAGRTLASRQSGILYPTIVINHTTERAQNLLFFSGFQPDFPIRLYTSDKQKILILSL